MEPDVEWNVYDIIDHGSIITVSDEIAEGDYFIVIMQVVTACEQLVVFGRLFTRLSHYIALDRQ